ncbi:MAG: FG-GAP-like repeat-containing protein, partial [Bacteroidales bacterium]|nr:FG-GAP-like repeat-containing protein [Bacteroidales bacterium]
MSPKLHHRVLLLFLHIIFANTILAQINTNLPVGAIPGVVDVTSMGAATYTIPIEVVPGTQGMQPNLSIVYNSMGGMGLLGMKWNLVGLSAITRSGQTPYYDNNISTIGFSRIANTVTLDGVRLIKTATINANGVLSEFATEIENFVRVYSHGILINGGPFQTTHFKAYTDDGSIIEYGNTSDSKQTLDASKVLSWYINKITDANGNYMTYHYGNDNGEIWINEIHYTGNTGMTPYAKVVFYYKNLPGTLGRNTNYVGGYAIPQTKLLETVTVSYGSSMVRQYKFVYNTENVGERTTHLKEIFLHGENGLLQRNSTIIEWGDKTATHVQMDINGLPAGNILTGDFNGDGYTDIIVYDIEGSGSLHQWECYLYNPSSNSYQKSKTGYYDDGLGFPVFAAQDINGDGKDELIIGWQLDYQNTGPYLELLMISPDISSAPFYTHNFENHQSLEFGDFDGNGSVDMIFLSKKKKNNKLNTWTVKCFMMSNNNLFTVANIDVPKRYFLYAKALDITGCGKKNLLVYNTETFLGDVYEYYSSTSFFEKNNQDIPVSISADYGDVNGDGITDQVVYCKENNKYKWKLLMGKGSGTTTAEYDLSKVLNTENNSNAFPSPLYGIKIFDLNGDGKEDIVQPVYNSTTNKTKFIILFSKGWVNGEYKYIKDSVEISGDFTFLSNWSFGDFKGNGKFDLLINNRGSNPVRKMISINQDIDYEYVKRIEDGVGKEIELNYTHRYFKTNDSQCLNKLFLSFVSSMKISNGIGIGKNLFQFEYENPVFSLKRRIYLGFKTFTSVNVQENLKNTQIFDLDISKQIMKLTIQNSYCSGTKTNEITSTCTIKTLPNNRFITYNSKIIAKDLLSDSKTETTKTLYSEGRLQANDTKTIIGCNSTTWQHSEIQTYTYQPITLSGNQKKTVPIQVLITQQYGTNGVVIADTVTYGYYSASEKGRLKWQRKGNIDGCITTNYEYLNSTGVCTLKTVSAAGCTPRTEKYSYDATGRFVTTITNALNHSTYLEYGAKTGNKLWEIDANMLGTYYIYDKYNRLTKIIHPDGTITKDTIYWFSAPLPSNAKYCTKTTTTGQPELIVYYDMLGREVCRFIDENYY